MRSSQPGLVSFDLFLFAIGKADKQSLAAIFNDPNDFAVDDHFAPSPILPPSGLRCGRCSRCRTGFDPGLDVLLLDELAIANGGFRPGAERLQRVFEKAGRFCAILPILLL
jgi:hypothetical protein